MDKKQRFINFNKDRYSRDAQICSSDVARAVCAYLTSVGCNGSRSTFIEENPDLKDFNVLVNKGLIRTVDTDIEGMTLHDIVNDYLMIKYEIDKLIEQALLEAPRLVVFKTDRPLRKLKILVDHLSKNVSQSTPNDHVEYSDIASVDSFSTPSDQLEYAENYIVEEGAHVQKTIANYSNSKGSSQIKQNEAQFFNRPNEYNSRLPDTTSFNPPTHSTLIAGEDKNSCESYKINCKGILNSNSNESDDPIVSIPKKNKQAREKEDSKTHQAEIYTQKNDESEKTTHSVNSKSSSNMAPKMPQAFSSSEGSLSGDTDSGNFSSSKVDADYMLSGDEENRGCLQIPLEHTLQPSKIKTVEDKLTIEATVPNRFPLVTEAGVEETENVIVTKRSSPCQSLQASTGINFPATANQEAFEELQNYCSKVLPKKISPGQWENISLINEGNIQEQGKSIHQETLQSCPPKLFNSAWSTESYSMLLDVVTSVPTNAVPIAVAQNSEIKNLKDNADISMEKTLTKKEESRGHHSVKKSGNVNKCSRKRKQSDDIKVHQNFRKMKTKKNGRECILTEKSEKKNYSVPCILSENIHAYHNVTNPKLNVKVRPLENQLVTNILISLKSVLKTELNQLQLINHLSNSNELSTIQIVNVFAQSHMTIIGKQPQDDVLERFEYTDSTENQIYGLEPCTTDLDSRGNTLYCYLKDPKSANIQKMVIDDDMPLHFWDNYQLCYNSPSTQEITKSKQDLTCSRRSQRLKEGVVKSRFNKNNPHKDQGEYEFNENLQVCNNLKAINQEQPTMNDAIEVNEGNSYSNNIFIAELAQDTDFLQQTDQINKDNYLLEVFKDCGAEDFLGFEDIDIPFENLYTSNKNLFDALPFEVPCEENRINANLGISISNNTTVPLSYNSNDSRWLNHEIPILNDTTVPLTCNQIDSSFVNIDAEIDLSSADESYSQNEAKNAENKTKSSFHTMPAVQESTINPPEKENESLPHNLFKQSIKDASETTLPKQGVSYSSSEDVKKRGLRSQTEFDEIVIECQGVYSSSVTPQVTNSGDGIEFSANSPKYSITDSYLNLKLDFPSSPPCLMSMTPNFASSMHLDEGTTKNLLPDDIEYDLIKMGLEKMTPNKGIVSAVIEKEKGLKERKEIDNIPTKGHPVYSCSLTPFISHGDGINYSDILPNTDAVADAYNNLDLQVPPSLSHILNMTNQN